MDLWKCEVVKGSGRKVEFIGDRLLVKEFLEYEMRDGIHGCVWVKYNVKEGEKLVWEWENIRWMFFYDEVNRKWKWERLVDQLSLF